MGTRSPPACDPRDRVLGSFTLIDPFLVFSDLDGTLLGHDDYRFDITLPWIEKVHSVGARVILATSKTQAEVQVWRERLQLDTPYIVENGSAIVDANGRIEVLGKPRRFLEQFLHPYAQAVQTLTDLPLDEAVFLTGLSEADALLAQDRHFSIPFQLRHPDIEETLRHAAEQAGLRIIKGGRFLHLQGDCDKADAVARIARNFEQVDGRRYFRVCLGDSENDRAMLEAADLPVVVRPGLGEPLKIGNRDTIYTQASAPQGWCDGIAQAFALLQKHKESKHGG